MFENRDGRPIGHRGHNGHPYTVPWGFYELLKYIYQTWGVAASNCLGREVDVVVTENGYAGQDEGDCTLSDIVNDVRRQEYYIGYVSSMVKAVEEGVPVRGYLAWSLLDNLEWNAGYAPRFGVTHVDRLGEFKRTPKNSAYVLKQLFQRLCRDSGHSTQTARLQANRS